MRIFLTGANGWIGAQVARELVAAGHSVIGLVRSAEKAAGLPPGVTPVIGSLADATLLRDTAAASDGVIHTAFGLDFSRMAAMAEEERVAIEAFGDAVAGSARPILVTGGVLLTPRGEVFTEASRRPVDPRFPRASEQTAFALADRGVHASVVRNPRTVHGKGETHGFVPMLAALARQRGVSAYVGEGDNLWPAVHRDDSARVYRLAIERGAAGEAYHAIAEEGVPCRLIAEAIGRQLGLPARSIAPADAEAHFGGIAMFAAGNGPASSRWTRETLGWEPRGIGLVEDIERPDYGGAA